MMAYNHHLSTPPRSQQFSGNPEANLSSIFPLTPPLSGEKPCDKLLRNYSGTKKMNEQFTSTTSSISVSSCVTVPVVATTSYNHTAIKAKTKSDRADNLDILSNFPTITIVNGDTTNLAKIINIRIVDNKVADVQIPQLSNVDNCGTANLLPVQQHPNQTASLNDIVNKEDDVNDSSSTNEELCNSKNRIGRPKKSDILSLQREGEQSESYLKCLVCKRIFPRIKSLEAHMRIHTGRLYHVLLPIRFS